MHDLYVIACEISFTFAVFKFGTYRMLNKRFKKIHYDFSTMAFIHNEENHFHPEEFKYSFEVVSREGDLEFR